MASASTLQLSPSAVGVVQWTLVGIEVLVLGYVVAWLGRNSRLGRLARRFRGRTTVSGDDALELDGAHATRMVSGGGASEPLRSDPAERARSRPVMRTPRALHLTRTPARGVNAAPADARAARAPATLHCPGCGTLLARGEVAARLVTRCTGCDRRVAVRLDGARVVVTLEG